MLLPSLRRRSGLYAMTAEITALGDKTYYDYDLAGRRIGQGDDDGGQTYFSYDPVGRLVARENVGADVTYYAYDANGNRTMMQDAYGTAYWLNLIHI